MGFRILLLGGTLEARLLAEQLLVRQDIEVIYSLAGALGKNAEADFRKRISQRNAHRLTIRVGGFGGVDGLLGFVTENKINLVIDATHPFAQRMSENAVAMSKLSECQIIRISRPAWSAQSGDNWTHVGDLGAACDALEHGTRAFLAIGKQSISGFKNRTDCWFLVRSLAPIDTSLFRSPIECIQAMPEDNLTAEIALMERFDIDCLVTKNSGASQAYYKLEAARHLGVRVIMVDRPSLPPCRQFHDITEAISWIDQQS